MFGDAQNKDVVMSIINVLLPDHRQVEVYTRIFNACEIAGFTEDKRIKYEKEMHDERRVNSEMKTAKRLGFEQGVKEGREELIRTIHSKGISVMEIARC